MNLKLTFFPLPLPPAINGGQNKVDPPLNGLTSAARQHRVTTSCHFLPGDRTSSRPATTERQRSSQRTIGQPGDISLSFKLAEVGLEQRYSVVFR